MKNIYVLPTDKPSKIYITSDEEIKAGDYCYDEERNLVFQFNSPTGLKLYIESEQKFIKKVILTTDQDLIKDGVQSIDEKFLEWFVKNPSCEFVEIIPDVMAPVYYEIIIPKEEPKQETLEDAYKFYPEDEQWIERYVFKLGAKCQAERMYSEEEVEKIAKDAYEMGRKNILIGVFNKWFEQFKKK